MEVTISNSPVHSTAKISYPYGVPDPSYSLGYHTGVDIVPSGETENNPLLYSVVNGTVVYINNTSNVALGVQCQILSDDGYYWRYCHMVLNSLQVNVGDRVDKNTIIGRMGATGNVTGRHLHLECSTEMSWTSNTFVNPCDRLGIPNVDDLIINYEESPVPPPPTPSIKKKFKWVLYAKKLRNKRIGY